MAMPRPEEALRALQPLVPYGSHLGAVIREHVERMRTLGFRYNENRFLHFDRFLQQQPGAAEETLSTLVRQYATLANSAATKLERIKARQGSGASLESPWHSDRGTTAGPPAGARDVPKALPTLYIHGG